MKTELHITNSHGSFVVGVGYKTNFGIVTGFSPEYIWTGVNLVSMYCIKNLEWSKPCITWVNALGQNETAFEGDDCYGTITGKIDFFKVSNIVPYKSIFTKKEDAEKYLQSLQPKWKDGDVVSSDMFIAIIEANGGSYINCVKDTGELSSIQFSVGRKWEKQATPEERQIIFDALAKEGKRFDFNKLEVVNNVREHKIVNTYYCGDCSFSLRSTKNEPCKSCKQIQQPKQSTFEKLKEEHDYYEASLYRWYYLIQKIVDFTDEVEKLKLKVK